MPCITPSQRSHRAGPRARANGPPFSPRCSLSAPCPLLTDLEKSYDSRTDRLFETRIEPLQEAGETGKPFTSTISSIVAGAIHERRNRRPIDRGASYFRPLAGTGKSGARGATTLRGRRARDPAIGGRRDPRRPGGGLSRPLPLAWQPGHPELPHERQKRPVRRRLRLLLPGRDRHVGDPPI